MRRSVRRWRGGDSSEAGRAFEGGDGGARGCEGVEQGAPMTACEVEGSDEDEVMAGKENISLQRAEGGSSLIGGIKKKRPQRRSKGAMSHRQRASDRTRSSMHGAGPRCRRARYCPLGCESGPECARAC